MHLSRFVFISTQLWAGSVCLLGCVWLSSVPPCTAVVVTKVKHRFIIVFLSSTRRNNRIQLQTTKLFIHQRQSTVYLLTLRFFVCLLFISCFFIEILFPVQTVHNGGAMIHFFVFNLILISLFFFIRFLYTNVTHLLIHIERQNSQSLA